MTKTCSVCKKDKPLTEYGYRKRRKMYRAACLECESFAKNGGRWKGTEVIADNPHKYFIGRLLLSGKSDDEFCDSEWFVALCNTAGWEPDYIRRLL